MFILSSLFLLPHSYSPHPSSTSSIPLGTLFPFSLYKIMANVIVKVKYLISNKEVTLG